MKKILALILSVLMLATAFCAVIPASAAVNIHTIFDLPAYYVGGANQASAHDITDGKITDGEYTFSETLESENKVAYGSYLLDASDNGGGFFANAANSKGVDQITLHMAHDETYVYIAIESNDAVDTKQRPYNILITRPNATTYGEMLDRMSFVIDRPVAGQEFANGTSQVTVYQYTRNTVINEDGSRGSFAMPASVVMGTAYDAYVTLDNANDKGLIEFKVTKQAIKECFGIDTVDQVGIALQHRMDDGNLACYFAKELSVWGDRKAVIDAYGLTATPCWLPYTMNLKTESAEEPEEPETPKTFAEIANLQNYYVGKAVTTAPTISDGKISAGEYTFAQTLTNTSSVDISTENDWLRQATQKVNTSYAGKDIVTLHMASDADNVYIAIEGRQPTTSEKNVYTIAITRPNPTTYYEMLDRVSWRFSGTYTVGTTKVTGGAYNSHTTVKTDGGRTWESGFNPLTGVEAYITIAENRNSLVEIKVTKAMLADAFNIETSEITNVGIMVQHLLYNWKASGTPHDATIGIGAAERTADYFQVLTDDQQAAFMKANDGLLTTYSCAPYMMNFTDAKVDTLNSASVRISSTDDKTGLRFKTVFNKADVEALVGAKDFTVGTIIVPADTLNGTAVTHAALNAASIKYIDVVADYDNPYASNAKTVTIAGSIVDIKEANLNRDFTAIGYICVDGTYYYSDSSTTTRNVKAIATIALNDIRANAFEEYRFEVSEGVYSPYTAAQRVMLSKLNGTYEA